MLCHSSFSQLTVREYLNTQPWREQIKHFREVYQDRRDATLSALSAMMPGRVPLDPPGRGLLRVAPASRRDRLQGHAAPGHFFRVAYVPGTGFYADGSGGQYARLCYSLPDPDRIAEGVRRLASVIETEIQLRDDFGPAPGIGVAIAPSQKRISNS